MIIALDQSTTSTAVVKLAIQDDGRLRLANSAVIRPSSTGVYRLNFLRVAIINQLNTCAGSGCTLLVREVHHQRQFGAASQLQALAGVIDLIAFDEGYHQANRYATIASSSWKKFITGKGNLSKDTAYLMILNKVLKKTPVFIPDDDFEVKDDNIADAICIGITGHVLKMIVDNNPLVNKWVTDTQISTLRATVKNVFDCGKPS